MDHGLTAGGFARQTVRISIASEEQRLIDQHCAVPDGRRAAKAGKGHAGNHGLNEEEQKAARQYGQQE